MGKLNIGCGSTWKVYEGFDGMDIYDYGQKYVADILDPKKGIAQLKDNSFDEVRAQHFMEHFNLDNVKYILNHVHRILKDGGVFKVCVPHATEHELAFILDHRSYWTEGTFKWFEREGEDTWLVYGLRQWKIDWINTNERKDIHCYLKPVKS